MKTLKILLLISSMFCISKAMTQTYYYNTSRDFNEIGYTYRCNTLDWGYVTLFDVTNIYAGAKYVYKDGSKITDMDILEGYVPLIEQDNWTKPKCMAIVNNAFSDGERQRVGGRKFMVVMTIDTDTGKVSGVHFKFDSDDPFATIPVSTYHKIEQALKEQVWFTLTDVGRQLKFIQRGWLHKVE